MTPLKDEYLTLPNGLIYNPATGETRLNGDDPNSPAYWYNPSAVGGPKTYYGGTAYAGRYDPYVIGSLTSGDYTYGTNKNQGYIDSLVNGLEKNAFLRSEKDYTDAFNTGVAPYQHLVFSDAYNQARKHYTGETFFDQIKNFDFGSLENPLDQNLPKQNSFQPAVEQNVTPITSPAPKAQEPTYATQPASPATPIVPDNTPLATDQQAQQPQTPGLDWGALYSQISNYFTEAAKKQALGTPQNREQIGSFQQFSPTIATRQKSYVSSTPYGSKGS